MKLLKKLLPIVTVASTAAVVAPMVTACSGFDMIDVSKKYTPSIKQYEPKDSEKSGVTEEAAKKIYLEQVSKNKDIMKQDAYWSMTQDPDFPTGVTMKVGVKVTSVDTSASTVDYEVREESKGKYTEESVTSEGDATLVVKVKKSKCVLTYDSVGEETGWDVQLGVYQSSDLGDCEITGKVTGSSKTTIAGITKEMKFSGKEIKITKDTTKPTSETELAEYEMIWSGAHHYFTSYFLAKLAHKA